MIKIDFDKYTNYDPVENIQRVVKEHQKEGSIYLLERDYAILAYDMGLGKTLSAIISAIENNKKTLIITPASLKYNWYKELEYFFQNGLIKKEEISIVKTGKEWFDNKIVICNYDLLKNFHEVKRGFGKRNSKIWDCNFELMICDEAHFCKNPKSQRSKLIYDISKGIDKVWLLTGTPITSKPINLYQLLKICRHEIVNNYFWFIKNYCDAKETKFGWDANGASNLTDLFFRLKNVLLRKRKEECLDLPGKQKTPIYFEYDTKKLKKHINKYYLETEGKIKEAVKNKDIESPYFFRDIHVSMELVELSLERIFCAEEMIPNTIELAENIIEQGKKVVIFTNYTSVLNQLKEHFGNKCVTLSGATKSTDKQKVVDRFQQDPNINVFISNLVAGGVGITLTKASDVIFNDLNYRADYHAQAEDRCYRMGQKEFVNCYYMIFDKSVSQIIYNILLETQAIINQILEGKSDLNQKMSNIDEVITRWKEGIFTKNSSITLNEKNLDKKIISQEIETPRPVILFNFEKDQFEINL